MIREKIDAGELEWLAGLGLLPTDGSVLIPLTMLWFETEHVASYIERATADDCEVVVQLGVETELPASRRLVARLRRRHRYMRFDTVDRELTRLGLNPIHLGPPLFSRYTPGADTSGFARGVAAA